MAKKQSPSTLLWFVRRKAYVPLCEIRRRFDIDGEDGSFLDGEDGARLFVGLPASSAAAIDKLWRQGKIGLELSVEFDCRVVIGVYPMVPVRENQLDAAPRPIRRPMVEIDPAEIFEDEPPQALAAGE
ncbi:MAG TPA: hypothetical protein VG815_08030 [Chloroflexota bacterium]|jgi:hypothetical protein|nr:hypothetical protein [Chloroflexota bacterium]